MAYRLLTAADAFWRESNQMKTLNTDLGKQLEASALGARMWRLRPGQASTRHRHFQQEELYLLLEGEGRVRIEDEVLTLGPLDALLIEAETVRHVSRRPQSNAAGARGALAPNCINFYTQQK